MNEMQATAVMATLFALRCVVPLVLMALIGYAMNRLVDRWEAEEAAQREEKSHAPIPIVAAGKQATVSTARQPKLPCWVFKNCDEQTRANCPAYRNPSLTCWVARMRADGTLPAGCTDCPLYAGAPAVA